MHHVPARPFSHRTALSALAITALTLTGCSNADTEGPAPEAEENTQAALDQGNGDVPAAFEDVLANPGSVRISAAAQYDPTGQYSYAVVDFTADGQPDLLLRADSTGISPVVLITEDGDGGVTSSVDTLSNGAARNGDTQIQVLGSRSGDGIYERKTDANDFQASSSHYTLSGDEITLEQTTPVKEGELLEDQVELIWRDTKTRKKLDGWYRKDDFQLLKPGASTAGSTSPTTSATSTEATDAADEPVEQGELVFTGTIRQITNAEIMDGGPTPNGEPADELHWIIELDSPQTVTGRTAGTETRTRTITQAYLGAPGSSGYDWDAYRGQHVRIVVDENNLWFPTDTGMPLGMLRIGTIISVS
ncbi:hypothetical protein KRX51_08985 [Corynebacterium sp. TAE3-ERU12]|uniref:hypothetical protein n=1 Tax=Corynebacterium sp. TAE3-ERU12 TaxID=2849491 RepID=UPI001C446D92|nr:hypothetical protein [Corynebacterium sp. TAE3-ERU12]MBV7296043.1 hypothetical protein [Corynebacterium sp. TAE3-ERU12]